MADFGKLAADIKDWQESAAWLTLLDPRSGEPIGGLEEPARILLTSPYSERWQQMEKAYHSQIRMAREQGPVRFTLEDVEKFEGHRIKCYMAVTREWEHIDRDGAPLACSPVNMEWLYSFKWVSDQLLAFMSDVANFGAPAGTANGMPGDVVEDAEKKLSTGAYGNSP